MSRRRAAKENFILPDAKYHNVVISKFINCLMHDGKRSVAEKAFYSVMEMLERELKTHPLEVFLESVDNVKPMVEVRSRRVGGATYQVPVEVRHKRQQTLAIKWIIDAARKRGDKSVAIKLYKELLDCYHKRGEAIKKRETAHKMAEANKAFSHYKWA
ncbi:MAG: 30S ribosomal protein S7 [Rickettsiales bacterium]